MSVSQEQIKIEVARLREMKPSVLRRSLFGEDHHDAIDAQIRVLEEGLSEDDVFTEFGDEGMDNFAQNILDSARDACNWLEGSEPDAPSVSWADLVR